MAVQGRIDILVIQQEQQVDLLCPITYQFLNFAIANNFSELSNPVDLLCPDRLSIS